MNKKENGFKRLIKDIIFITLLAVIFFIIVAKFGGYVSDFVTKSSCKAIDEKYVEGKNPGEGYCVKTIEVKE